MLHKFKLDQGGESSTLLSFAVYLTNKTVTLLCLCKYYSIFNCIVHMSRYDATFTPWF